MKLPMILRIFKNGQLVEVKQFSAEQVIVGASTDAQLVLSDPSVSDFHCVIELRPQGYFVGDLGSQSGTFLQGQKVLESAVSSGQKITVGVFEIHFFVGAPKSDQSTKPAVEVAVKPEPTPTSAPKIVVDPEQKKETPKAAPTLSSKPPISRTAVPNIPLKVKTSVETKASKQDRHTFAPPSSVQDLKTYLKATQGPVLEVVVAWKERILNCLHFQGQKTITLGSSSGSNILVPSALIPTQIGLIDLKSGAQLFVPAFAQVESIQSGRSVSQEQLLETGNAKRLNDGVSVPVRNGDLLHVNFSDTGWNLFIRYIPHPPIAPAAPSSLSAGQMSVLLLTAAFVVFLSFAISVVTPDEKDPETLNEPIRHAQFVYKKKVEVREQGDPKEELGERQAPVKVEARESKKEEVKQEKSEQAQQNQAKAAKAQEVRAKDPKQKSKQFTSTHQGGATRLSKTDSANAQSQKDVTKTGVLGAFSGAGVRSQLNRAYSGSGELLGMADKATGTSGQNENRTGGDIGSKFKDTGAGGKGTATQGIGGIGTKGRSSGQGSYGDLGVGGKGSVSIVSSGEGAGFTGGLDKAGIRRTVQSMLGEIKACYEKGLRASSSIEGKVMIQFEIDDKGQVIKSGVASSSLADNEVGDCVANRIRMKRFPPSPVGVVGVVDYPFVFGVQK